MSNAMKTGGWEVRTVTAKGDAKMAKSVVTVAKLAKMTSDKRKAALAKLDVTALTALEVQAQADRDALPAAEMFFSPVQAVLSDVVAALAAQSVAKMMGKSVPALGHFDRNW